MTQLRGLKRADSRTSSTPVTLPVRAAPESGAMTALWQRPESSNSAVYVIKELGMNSSNDLILYTTDDGEIAVLRELGVVL